MKPVIVFLSVLLLFTLTSNAQTTLKKDTTKIKTRAKTRTPRSANATAVTPPKSSAPDTSVLASNTRPTPVKKQKTNYIDKTNNALNGANNAVNGANGSVTNAGATGTNAVNTAANASTQAKSLGSQVSTLFGKKPADGTVNTTQISVKGAKFATLKKLNESIMECSGVQDSKMKFSSDVSTITVSHTGSTEKLLKSIQKKTNMIADENIDNFDEGIIAVTLK